LVSDAWDEHDTRDASGGENVSWDNGRIFEARIESSGYPDYKARATSQILCLLFDTTDTLSSPVEIILRLNIDIILRSFETPTIQVYHIEETFTTDHYDNPGTFIHEGDVSSTGNYDITLSSDDVNFGDTTRIILRVKQMLVGNRPDSIPSTSAIYLNVDLCSLRFEY